MSQSPGTFDPEKFTELAKNSWSESAPSYEKISSAYFSTIADVFLDFAGLKPGQEVLDVACGPGTATLKAAARIAPSGRVIGADIAPGMLALAGGNAKNLGIDNVEFREMRAESLSLPAASFDAVLCQLGLMLFAHPEAALSELVRVAKKGAGVSCLVQGTPEGMVFTSLLNLIAVKHAPQLKVPGAPNLYRFGAVGALEKIFSEAGLSAVRSERLSGTFAFASPEDYWGAMTSGSGRMKNMLDGLQPAVQKTIREESLAKAKTYITRGRVELPYEFVMASGIKS